MTVPKRAELKKLPRWAGVLWRAGFRIAVPQDGRSFTMPYPTPEEQHGLRLRKDLGVGVEDKVFEILTHAREVVGRLTIEQLHTSAFEAAYAAVRALTPPRRPSRRRRK
jgi:hypothetical protein